MQMKVSEYPLGVDPLYVNIKLLERPTKAKFCELVSLIAKA